MSANFVPKNNNDLNVSTRGGTNVRKIPYSTSVPRIRVRIRSVRYFAGTSAPLWISSSRNGLVYNISMRTEVLGLPVDILSKQETLEKISDWIRAGIKKPKLVITAYSEFFVRAHDDPEFAKVMAKADLVTPDGRSVLAAAKYIERTRGIKNSRNQGRWGLGKRLFEGVKVGGDILANNLGETVTGVFLFEELTKRAAERGWKVFLLGGWENVSGRTAEVLLERFATIR